MEDERHGDPVIKEFIDGAGFFVLGSIALLIGTSVSYSLLERMFTVTNPDVAGSFLSVVITSLGAYGVKEGKELFLASTSEMRRRNNYE